MHLFGIYQIRSPIGSRIGGYLVNLEVVRRTPSLLSWLRHTSLPIDNELFLIKPEADNIDRAGKALLEIRHRLLPLDESKLVFLLPIETLA